jgi:hypothetical protein
LIVAFLLEKNIIQMMEITPLNYALKRGKAIERIKCALAGIYGKGRKKSGQY